MLTTPYLVLYYCNYRIIARRSFRETYFRFSPDFACAVRCRRRTELSEDLMQLPTVDPRVWEDRDIEFGRQAIVTRLPIATAMSAKLPHHAMHQSKMRSPKPESVERLLVD